MNEAKIKLAASMLLTPAELAAILRVSQRKLRAMKSSGEIPRPVKIGKRAVRYRRDQIEAWIAKLPLAA